MRMMREMRIMRRRMSTGGGGIEGQRAGVDHPRHDGRPRQCSSSRLDCCSHSVSGVEERGRRRVMSEVSHGEWEEARRWRRRGRAAGPTSDIPSSSHHHRIALRPPSLPRHGSGSDWWTSPSPLPPLPISSTRQTTSLKVMMTSTTNTPSGTGSASSVEQVHGCAPHST